MRSKTVCENGIVGVEGLAWEAGLMSSVLLVCAVVASLGVGVMAAQVICVGMFRVFRMHARQVAAAREVKVSAVATRLDVLGS